MRLQNYQTVRTDSSAVIACGVSSHDSSFYFCFFETKWILLIHTCISSALKKLCYLKHKAAINLPLVCKNLAQMKQLKAL